MMTKRHAATPAPGPLAASAQHCDDLFSTVSQRDAFRQYLAGLLPTAPASALPCRSAAARCSTTFRAGAGVPRPAAKHLMSRAAR